MLDARYRLRAGLEYAGAQSCARLGGVNEWGVGVRHAGMIIAPLGQETGRRTGEGESSEI